MDPWDHIRRAAADRRSGSVAVATRAARGLAEIGAKRDVVRAARALLRAHPAMGALWRLLAAAYEDGPRAAAAFAERLEEEQAAACDAARWLIRRRRTVVLTHSGSGAVADALDRARARVSRVVCTVSLPGAEGRPFARRLERDGFEVEVVPDAALAAAAREADVALVGCDALSEDGVTNKVGTRLVALAARDANVGCYAIAASSKVVPATIAERVHDERYEQTPLALFDAVVTERGPLRPAPVRRTAARVTIPDAIAAVLR